MPVRLSSTDSREKPVSRASEKSENTSMSNYDTWLVSDPVEDYWHALRRRADDAEPFFTVAEPCEDCGRPKDDCQCSIPDEPLCPELARLLDACKSITEIQAVSKTHVAKCECCNPRVVRMQPRGQERQETGLQEAA